MNENLTRAIKAYSIQSHSEYANQINGLSKDTLAGMFSDLLTQYINDKNSSTVREFVTVSVAGYRHSEKKIGFNGYKHTAPGEVVECEAKPKNIDTETFHANKASGKTLRKLNGGGNFTDYTWARYGRDLEANLNMLVSGFVDGKLIYILEFPYNDPGFSARLREQLEAKFPNGDVPGAYLRSANFTYNNFIDSANVHVVFLNRELIQSCEPYIAKPFYKRLIELPPVAGSSA